MVQFDHKDAPDALVRVRWIGSPKRDSCDPVTICNSFAQMS